MSSDEELPLPMIPYEVDMLNQTVRTLVHRAVRINSLPLVQRLVTGLSHATDVQDQWGRTPLFIACRYNFVDCARWLVQVAGADVTVADENGYTPLHVASSACSVDCVKFLVDTVGMDVHHLTRRGLAPVEVIDPTGWHSSRSDPGEILQFLLARDTLTDRHRLVHTPMIGCMSTCQMLLDLIEQEDGLALQKTVLLSIYDADALRRVVEHLARKGTLSRYLAGRIPYSIKTVFSNHCPMLHPEPVLLDHEWADLFRRLLPRYFRSEACVSELTVAAIGAMAPVSVVRVIARHRRWIRRRVLVEWAIARMRFRVRRE